MNPDSGAIYPDVDTAMFFGEDPSDIVEMSGEPDALTKAAEAIEARAKAQGRHKPGSIPSARELRRYLERHDG